MGYVRCCLLGVCCPPEAQIAQVAEFLREGCPTMSEADSLGASEWLLKRFDLAPKGFAEILKSAAAQG